MIRAAGSDGVLGRASVVEVQPRDYRIVVEGELGPRYQAAFESMQLKSHHGTTAIIGPVQDEAQLRGLLDTVSALGLSLVSVTREGDRPHD